VLHANIIAKAQPVSCVCYLAKVARVHFVCLNNILYYTFKIFLFNVIQSAAQKGQLLIIFAKVHII